ncbi:MAG: hypothetical protein WCO57_11680, partial [Verrucomicrobiota bacterium]
MGGAKDRRMNRLWVFVWVATGKRRGKITTDEEDFGVSSVERLHGLRRELSRTIARIEEILYASPGFHPIPNNAGGGVKRTKKTTEKN